MRCRSCNHDNRSERRYCAECGVALGALCAACGASNEPGEKYCGACGASLGAAPIPSTAPSHPAAVTLGPTEAGERRHLTALFCDLVGSTDIASRLDPEEWHRISKAYQEAAAAAVTRFGGHVDKFLGDGLVCFFGVPEAHEDDAERAVRAGLAIVDAVQSLNGNAAEQAVELQVRVGLHTGSAVVAHGGGASKDVFGDTPNIAARVQGAADPDTVMITAATQRLVAGVFVVEERGAPQLKGVPQPVVLFRVVQPSGVRSRLDVSAGHHTPFIGRQSELGVLADAWERVVEGMGQTLLVQGEAGIGKSRLCYQLREQLNDQPHTWLECRCSPYTTGTPFRPVIELVEQALTFQPADTPADKLDKLEIGLERGGFVGDETVALLAEWLELPEGAGYTPLSISPDLKRRKTFEALAAWNLTLAELQPMVVLVEDLHWGDPSSLELLGRLVAQSATAHVLLVGTARPEFARPWPARSNLQTLTLSRLTKRQMREMVTALSAARALPEAVVEQLVTRADGIPLFAEELTQAVMEAGSDAAVVEVPVTLQDSLLARLDRLSAAKDVAQRAAVLGREFGYLLLAATAGLDQAALRQGLARLVDAEILFARGEPPAATYTFKHALIQETAYQSLLKRTRQDLHGRVLRVLEEQFPGRVAAEPEVAARHAEAAGRTDEAVTYYQRAGEQAQARSAHEEAIEQLRKAIALVGTLPTYPERDAREAGVQMVLGRSLVAARGYAHAETEAAHERARVLCEAAGNAAMLPLVLLSLSNLYVNRGDPEQSITLAERVLAVSEETRDRSLVIQGHVNAALAKLYQGRFAPSLAHCERVIALDDPARRQAETGVLATDAGVSALGFAGWNLVYLGHADRSLGRAREGVALARRLADPFSMAFALFQETLVHRSRGDWRAQGERAADLIALGDLQGFPLFRGLGRIYHGLACVMTGEGAAAWAEVAEGLALAAGTGNRGGVPGLMVILAEAQRSAGQHAEAVGTIESGLTVATETGQHFCDASLHRLKGEVLLASQPGCAAEAEALFLRALEIARGQEAKTYELRAATSLARLWRDQGKRTEARDLLAPVYGWFTEGFDTRDLQDAKTLLEELR
jgi:class 3 adenylate cyclase/predicted ATPase